MQWSPRCGGRELGCSAADASMEARQPSNRSCSSRWEPSTTRRDLRFGRHRPHVLHAASAFRSRPGVGFRKPGDFRLSELFDWLHFIPPPKSRGLLKQKRVIDAPKKNFKRCRSLPSGLVLGFPCPASGVPARSDAGTGRLRRQSVRGALRESVYCLRLCRRLRGSGTPESRTRGRRGVRDCVWLFSGCFLM